MTHYDIIVIGSGMIGTAVALGFAKQGRQVMIVEHYQLDKFIANQPMDLRVSAISQASVQLLKQIGAWDTIMDMRVCPYRRLETWEFSENRLCFDSQIMGLSQLGYIIENRIIQLGLLEQFSKYENLVISCPDKLKHIEFNSSNNRVFLESGKKLIAKWVIGADGSHSLVRKLANIRIIAWDYRQYCLCINVKTELSQQDITWQYFTSSGPRSFLPLCGNHASLVWYDSPNRIKELFSMNSKQLCLEIMEHFPKNLGKIQVLEKGFFSLLRSHARKYLNKRCVLVGDAAHTIHPLAGQGVNMGFKDVSSLLKISDKVKIDEVLFSQYEEQRRFDNLLMQNGLELLYQGFGNDILPLKIARNAMIKFIDSSKIIKKRALRYALGL
ncbi:2-octaprenyl-3-methyl-6-methoxy-1,4-benzoquinol hydroxylase [Candidatus Photodesmus katoptron]|uniref:1-octaprenyl-3-methyl-6-methoxy-1,4-benzoquinol hydroxylase n=1 Tax=Candidatus Photodesmus katoptron Akat1 TaxID=1236703 RepID=S3EGV0_9GAMM|nr:FAD-dependent monooxygenase [Candidatus Photodesmus katoptron]EPE37388.1 1-octaprenyl-3-methyl-6-methoxy-1,4-benzoquinol hydroxylase [Candidatus Photodesmus katoptron Akat1]KEY90795.1 2-octaprenyl-3-methyl-6-methoxy-1,4-benzoquinol hydroxylase [Candidatus Photodesmus katoptron]